MPSIQFKIAYFQHETYYDCLHIEVLKKEQAENRAYHFILMDLYRITDGKQGSQTILLQT